MAKRYFVERGVTFTEHDVSNDQEALQEMVTSTGQYGVPVIVVGGHAMVGWDANEFQRMLTE